MDIVIDLQPLLNAANQPAHIFMWNFFITVGWIPIAFTFLWGAKELWMFYIQQKWGAQHKFILLAIDIPRGNEQSPKAVENIFSYLAGAHGSINLIEKYWDGKFQLSLSFEIVSIEGYTQFLVHTPVQFKNLVESAIYSQYPDAEITEVNDYTDTVPTRYPDDEYDVWGAEFIQNNSSAYPIKTYKDFEHQFGRPETQYKDPMAALMDLCSTLRKGEQLWFQILLTPIGFDWPSIGDKEISKVIGEKTVKKSPFAPFTDFLLVFLDQISGTKRDPAAAKNQVKEISIMNLKPKPAKQIQAIQEKVGKIGFNTKMRFIYIGRKEVLNKPKVVNGFVGYMKQFASMDLNNIKPDMAKTATATAYFFKEKRLNKRKRMIVRGYKDRDTTVGKLPGILNIEELATIWHFPIAAVVKAPLIQKAPGRKAEAPMGLPMTEEGMGSDEAMRAASREDLFEDGAEQAPTVPGKQAEKNIPKASPPENLPFA